MSRITIATTIVFVLISIVGALTAIAFDTTAAEAKSHFLAKGSDSALVKHTEVAPDGRLDNIPFGSDDGYYAKAERLPHAAFGTFLTIVASMLPNTSAPDSSLQTCTLPDGHGGTFETQAADCSQL